MGTRQARGLRREVRRMFGKYFNYIIDNAKFFERVLIAWDIIKRKRKE